MFSGSFLFFIHQAKFFPSFYGYIPLLRQLLYASLLLSHKKHNNFYMAYNEFPDWKEPGH